MTAKHGKKMSAERLFVKFIDFVLEKGFLPSIFPVLFRLRFLYKYSIFSPLFFVLD